MARAEPRSHTVLITGANDGIGLWLAKNYAKRGHRVLATGRQTISDDATHFGSQNVTYIRADQEQPMAAAQNIANAMRDLEWNGLDLAILNAGTGWVGMPQEETPASIAKQVDVNLTANICIAKAMGPWLFRRTGKLVFIGSTAMKKPQGNFATYTATKAALAGFARSLHEEWRGRASVQMIHPRATRTGMHGKAGLNIGIARALFMSPKKAARAIMASIRASERQRDITRTFAFLARFSRNREGYL